jgi:hypothetical protein
LDGVVQRKLSIQCLDEQATGTLIGEALDHLQRRVSGSKIQRKISILFLYEQGIGAHIREALDHVQRLVRGSHAPLVLDKQGARTLVGNVPDHLQRRASGQQQRAMENLQTGPS